MTHPAARPRSGRGRRPHAVVAGLAAAVVALASCGDDPFLFRWEASPDTVLLYSLARPELNLAAAFNFTARSVIRVESASATGTWDVALDTRGGELVFLPPGALGVSSHARVTALEGMSFAEVEDAPADTAVYSSSQALPIRTGTTYVVRTDRRAGSFGASCVYYAKLEPLAIDVAGGTLTFVFDASPICNSLRLVPPD